MRLLQRAVTVATVSLFHRAERLLLVDAPQRHRAEVRHEGVCKDDESLRREKVLRLPYPSSAPVMMCSSFMSWMQSIEPLKRDGTIGSGALRHGY